MKCLIREALKEKGWSQGKLAQLAGIDRIYLNKIVRGVTTDPRISTAIKIAQALKKRAEDLWV